MASFEVHNQRNREADHPFHDLTHHSTSAGQFFPGRLQKHFIMDLQEHPASQPSSV